MPHGNRLLTSRVDRAPRRGHSPCVRMMSWLESTLQDLRYGVRSLRRERMSSGAVVVMLALGIGANVTIFTLLNAIWLRPLAYRDADRLVTVEDPFTRLGIRSWRRT